MASAQKLVACILQHNKCITRCSQCGERDKRSEVGRSPYCLHRIDQLAGFQDIASVSGWFFIDVSVQLFEPKYGHLVFKTLREQVLRDPQSNVDKTTSP